MKNIIHGDCLEVMKEIESGSVDLIVTDPPYGTMKGVELDGWGKGKTDWDVAVEPDVLFSEFERVLREKGQIVMFSQEPYTSKIRTFNTHNIEFCYPLIWEKDHFANALIAKKAPVSYFEDINIFVKKYDTDLLHPLRKYSQKLLDEINISLKGINKKLNHRKAEHFFYWNTSQFKLPTKETYDELIDVFEINTFDFYITYEDMKNTNQKFIKKFIKIFNLPETKKYKPNIFKYKKDYEGLHPTQKPVKLLEDLIKTYSNEQDIILDCFAGSGSTGIACLNTNRNFILIEKEEKYYDIMVDRIKNHNINMNV